MFKEIFRFEIAYHIGQPLFGLTAAVLFLFALMLGSTDMAVAFTNAPQNVSRDAPYVIMHLMAGLTSIGIFVVTAFVASSVLRDFRLGTHMLFFSKPISKRDYLLGRFLGSMVLSLALFVAPLLGLVVARFVPWQDPERIGSFVPAGYVAALLVMALPNLVAMGALFFAIASWSRSMLASYICVVFFVGIQDYAESLARDFTSLSVGALFEPLGVVALEAETRYWAMTEYNTALPGLGWVLLGNRLVWVGIGLLFFAVSYARFSYSRATARRWWARRRVEVSS